MTAREFAELATKEARKQVPGSGDLPIALYEAMIAMLEKTFGVAYELGVQDGKKGTVK